eukprot:1524637-Prymnesium_polylepis.2
MYRWGCSASLTCIQVHTALSTCCQQAQAASRAHQLWRPRAMDPAAAADRIPMSHVHRKTHQKR